MMPPGKRRRLFLCRAECIAHTLRVYAALDLVECLRAGCLGGFFEDARATWLLRKADALAALGRRDAYRDSGRHDASECNALLKAHLYADADMANAQRVMDECADRMNGVRVTRPSLVTVICDC